jgi:hypothetical protein
MAISGSGSEPISSETCGSIDETSSDEEPPIPRTVHNWWLNEKLGSGYSGKIPNLLLAFAQNRQLGL